MEIIFCVAIGIIVGFLVVCVFVISHSIERIADNIENISRDFLELLANIEEKESE